MNHTPTTRDRIAVAQHNLDEALLQLDLAYSQGRDGDHLEPFISEVVKCRRTLSNAKLYHAEAITAAADTVIALL